MRDEQGGGRLLEDTEERRTVRDRTGRRLWTVRRHRGEEDSGGQNRGEV